MKKKLFLMLSLFFLVIPLFAGCEDAPDMVKLSVSMKKVTPENPADDFSLNDCASVEAPEEFEKGKSGYIIVKYVSNICLPSQIIVSNSDETVNVQELIQRATKGDLYDQFRYSGISMDSNKSVEVEFVSKNAQLSSSTVKFNGVYKVEGTTTTLLPSANVAFPFKNSSNKHKLSASFNGTSKTVVSKQKFSDLFFGPDIDLNYVYEVNTSGATPTYKLLQHKVKWMSGKYDSVNSTCNFEAMNAKTEDITTFEVSNDTSRCVQAIVDVTPAADGNSASQTPLKEQGLENLHKSQIYVTDSAGPTDTCYTATNTAVSDNCMYVANLGGLYPTTYDMAKNKNSLYVGKTKRGELESVVTQSAGKMYYVCNTTDSICKASDTKSTSYTLDSWEMLGLSGFISALKNSDIKAKDITYDYDYRFQGIVATKIQINSTTYTIDYVDLGVENVAYKDNTVKIETNVSLAKPSNLYEVKINANGTGTDKEKLEELVATLTDKVYTTADYKKEIKEAIYKFIDGNSSYNSLKNYIYSIQTGTGTGNKKQIEIKFENAVLDLDLDSGYYFEFTNTTSQRETCHSTMANNNPSMCVENSTQRGILGDMLEYIDAITSNLSNSGIKNIEKTSKTVNGSTRYIWEYNFGEENLVSYEEYNKTFIYKGYEIKLLEAIDVSVSRLEVSATINAPMLKYPLVQTYDGETVSTILKDGNDTDLTGNEYINLFVTDLYIKGIYDNIVNEPNEFKLVKINSKDYISISYDGNTHLIKLDNGMLEISLKLDGENAIFDSSGEKFKFKINYES